MCVDELKHKLGNAPNSEFVLDPEGKVVRHRGWSAPGELRKDLEQLIGAVEKPTQIADLKLKTAPPPKAAASGVVPRVQVSGSMRAFKVAAEKSKEPHYIKLRAEVDQNFMSNGLGNLCGIFRHSEEILVINEVGDNGLLAVVCDPELATADPAESFVT